MATTEDLSSEAGWAAFVQRHGGLVGSRKMDPDFDPQSRRIKDPVYHYEFADGSTIDASRLGLEGVAIKSITEKATKATPDELQVVNDPRTNKPIALTGPGTTINLPSLPDGWSGAFWARNADGSETRMGINPATGNTEPVPGPDGKPITQAATAGSTAAPHIEWQPRQLSTGEWVEDPTQWDPKAGTFVPASGLAPRPSKNPRGEPTKADLPTFIDLQGTKYAVIPDKTQPTGYRLEKPATPPGENHEPYNDIQGGFQVLMRWVEGEGKYKPDPSVAPVPWSPEAKASAAKTAAQPTEGQTRDDAIVGGYHVKQRYSGGEWITTEVGQRATPREIQTLSTSSDQPFVYQTDEQGNPQWVQNQNYQPKAPTTRGDVAMRVANLQQQMAAMHAKIKADATIPAEQQADRFNQWYAQTIQPQMDALDKTQQAIGTEEAAKAVEAYQKNITAAANAIQSTAPYRVGPGYGQAMEKVAGKALASAGITGVDLSNAFTFKGPDLDQHINNLLKNVSPTAAAAAGAGQPNYAGIDIQNALSPTRYGFGETPVAGPSAGPATPAAGAGAANPNVNPDWLAAWRTRQTLDEAQQARQAQVAQPGVPQDPNAALRARMAEDAMLQQRQAQVGQPGMPQQGGPPAAAGPVASMWRPPSAPAAAPPVPTPVPAQQALVGPAASFPGPPAPSAPGAAQQALVGPAASFPGALPPELTTGVPGQLSGLNPGTDFLPSVGAPAPPPGGEFDPTSPWNNALPTLPTPLGLWDQVGPNPQTQEELRRLLNSGTWQPPY